MLDSEICSLKIRVSVVRFRPWPPHDLLRFNDLESLRGWERDLECQLGTFGAHLVPNFLSFCSGERSIHRVDRQSETQTWSAKAELILISSFQYNLKL